MYYITISLPLTVMKLIEDIHVVSNLFPTIYHKLNSLYKKNYPSDNQVN